MNSTQQISDSELEIMEIIWKNSNTIMFGQLMKEIEHRQWKPNTVLTFLTRLLDKGIIMIRKQGRLNQYVALMTREEYLEALTNNFLDKVYGGDVKVLMTNLLKNNINAKDFNEIKEFWEKEGK